MSIASTSQDRLFAWNGLSFKTPRNWELSDIELSQGLNRIVMEDDFQPRLELDWLVCNQKLNLEKVQKRCHKQSEDLTATAEKVVQVTDIPPEWTAFEYRMKDRRTLLIGYRVPEQTDQPFAFFRLHFTADTPEVPAVCFRNIANSFEWTATGPRKWRFYDVDFDLDARFRLTGTSLLAGQKTLSFEWGLRRLVVVHVNLADLALKQKSLCQWGADFLNAGRLFPAVNWLADETANKIIARRKRRFVIGQFEEIGRWCFKYEARIHQDITRNQIRLLVFNYRSPDDLRAALPN